MGRFMRSEHGESARMHWTRRKGKNLHVSKTLSVCTQVWAFCTAHPHLQRDCKAKSYYTSANKSTHPVSSFQDYGIWLSLILSACLDMDAVKERVLAPGKAGLKKLAGKTLAHMQRYKLHCFFLSTITLTLDYYSHVNYKNTHHSHYIDQYSFIFFLLNNGLCISIIFEYFRLWNIKAKSCTLYQMIRSWLQYMSLEIHLFPRGSAGRVFLK